MKIKWQYISVAVLIISAITFALFVAHGEGDDENGIFRISWDFVPQTRADSLVTHFELWMVTFVGDPIQLINGDIPVVDRQVDFTLPSDGSTYYFAMRSVHPGAKSLFSNIVSITSKVKTKPNPPTVIGVSEN